MVWVSPVHINRRFLSDESVLEEDGSDLEFESFEERLQSVVESRCSFEFGVDELGEYFEDNEALRGWSIVLGHY